MTLGIKNLKEVVGFALSLGELAEGLIKGIGAEDMFNAIEVVKRAPAAIKDIGQVIPEFSDLDEGEKAALKSFIEQDFDLESDNIEEIVETALKVAVNLSALMGFFKK